jgi:hypothetical protein
MLETGGNKQLDRTYWWQTVVSRATANRTIRITSTNSSKADGLASIQDNSGSLTLSHKSWSKTEFCELAPSGCSRWKNRSHARFISNEICIHLSGYVNSQNFCSGESPMFIHKLGKIRGKVLNNNPRPEECLNTTTQTVVFAFQTA